MLGFLPYTIIHRHRRGPALYILMKTCPAFVPHHQTQKLQTNHVPNTQYDYGVDVVTRGPGPAPSRRAACHCALHVGGERRRPQSIAFGEQRARPRCPAAWCRFRIRARVPLRRQRRHSRGARCEVRQRELACVAGRGAVQDLALVTAHPGVDVHPGAGLLPTRYVLSLPATHIACASSLRTLKIEHYIFAWGNPLVSSPAALEKTARAFIAFAEASRLHPVWCCVDHDLEAALASPTLGWATLSCIYEDVLDPAHVVELVDPKLGHHTPAAEHLMKSLTRAEKSLVTVHEVKYGAWHAAEREAVENGVNRAHSGVEFHTMSAKPWLDEEHRRYWIAVKDGKARFSLLYRPSADINDRCFVIRS